MEKLFPYLFVDLRLRVTQHLFQSMSQWTLQIKTVLTQFLLVFKNRWKSGTWQKPRDRRLTVTAELVSLKLLKVGKWKQGGRERCLDLRGYQAGLRASAFPSVIKKKQKMWVFFLLEIFYYVPPATPPHHTANEQPGNNLSRFSFQILPLPSSTCERRRAGGGTHLPHPPKRKLL